MENPLIMLLKSRNLFWDRISSKHDIGSTVLYLLLFITVSSAAYGAVLAGWRSPLLSFYVAIKMPILLLGTTTLVMLLNWIFAGMTGSGLSFKQVVAITYGAMGVTCWILLSLTPVTALFTFSVASGGTHAEQQLTHNYLLMAHIILIAFAGIAGNCALKQGLDKTILHGCSARKIYWSWIASFTIVGCQLSWILRPFIGSPFYAIEFMRPDALKRNFFEFIYTDVLPYIIKGGS
ncbi:MAG: hypothetical protein A2283_07390 [Lentisphaerae bacterium RIFOXYA12_FULL_48_11]|nr:MAG: hypothetical protein A2283_07390 [Lentisphaerae bacterium RIFOXYA12_FULL_48_11]